LEAVAGTEEHAHGGGVCESFMDFGVAAFVLDLVAAVPCTRQARVGLNAGQPYSVLTAVCSL